MAAPARPDPLHPGELVPPGEIGDDLLGVTQIVDQLADLIRTVDMGSAIGLFGSPGVGKTTLGRRLKSQRLLSADGKLMTYVRVDASQAAGPGFRRRLVTRCAKKLGKNEGRVERQLRGASSDSRFGPLEPRHLRLIPPILLILAVMVAIGLAIALAVAWATGDEFDAIADQFVLAMLFAPALAAAAFGVVVKSATTDWSMPAPSGDDEFVTVFRNLFEPDERLLVFVDEIDRAPPDRIADTLDGLRTFFWHKHCVFLVAADRQTLEHALSAWLGESTPDHAANPYYGAASAYLDKLFQYQLSIPPPRTDTLYQYARRATRDRPGVWETLNEDDARSREVIKVLIPSHVTSPRQVDSLLNGFALTWRLLVRREPLFDVGRMAEVAKLVCLRSEFPLFAADLHVDPELPARVLAAAPGDERSQVESQQEERARAYAEGRLPVTTIPPESDQASDGTGSAVEHELRRQQSRQLVAYLHKTSDVKGPRPDVIHAQTFRSDLPSRLAEDLSNAALRRDTGKLDRAIARIREHAKAEAEAEADEAGESSVRKAERDAIDLLTRRTRAKQTAGEINAFRSLLYVVWACAPALDPVLAAKVLSRTEHERKQAASELSDADRTVLALLEQTAGPPAGEEALPEAPAAEKTAGAPSLPYS